MNMSKKVGCPKGSHRVKGRCRSIKEIKYHGRVGHPIIHETSDGKQYIMTRAKGGGVKRLYLVNGKVPKKHA